MLVEGVAVAGRNDVQILGSRGTREKIYFRCPKKKKFCYFLIFFKWHTHTHTHTPTNKHTHTQTHTYTITHTHTRTHTHTHIHTHIHTHTLTESLSRTRLSSCLPLVKSMAATAVLPAPLVHLAALPQTDTVQAAILHTDVRRLVLSAVAGVVNAGDWNIIRGFLYICESRDHIEYLLRS